MIAITPAGTAWVLTLTPGLQAAAHAMLRDHGEATLRAVADAIAAAPRPGGRPSRGLGAVMRRQAAVMLVDGAPDDAGAMRSRLTSGVNGQRAWAKELGIRPGRTAERAIAALATMPDAGEIREAVGEAAFAKWWAKAMAEAFPSGGLSFSFIEDDATERPVQITAELDWQAAIERMVRTPEGRRALAGTVSGQPVLNRRSVRIARRFLAGHQVRRPWRLLYHPP